MAVFVCILLLNYTMSEIHYPCDSFAITRVMLTLVWASLLWSDNSIHLEGSIALPFCNVYLESIHKGLKNSWLAFNETHFISHALLHNPTTAFKLHAMQLYSPPL